MAHNPQKAVIDTITQRRLDRLPTVEKGGVKVLEDFAIFIDTHRDQPHVGVFHEDLHRGMCVPMKVDYIVGEDLIWDPESGVTLQRHEKHMFVTESFYADWMLEFLMQNDGNLPGPDGIPTSHFRDARNKVYALKSFREIVRLRAIENGINL